MSGQIKVIVADDHPLYRDGVVASLKESGMFEICGAGASADEAIERAYRTEVTTADADAIRLPHTAAGAPLFRTSKRTTPVPTR